MLSAENSFYTAANMVRTESEEGLWFFGVLSTGCWWAISAQGQDDRVGSRDRNELPCGWELSVVSRLSTPASERMTGEFMLEGALEVSSPASYLKQGQLWGQTRHLKTLSSLVLKSTQDGGSTVSPSNLFQCLTVLLGKKSLFITRPDLSPFSLNLESFILPPSSTVKSLVLYSWWSPYRYWRSTQVSSCQSHLVLQPNQPGSLSPSPSA